MINSYFDKIICINLKHRADRWKEVSRQCQRAGIAVERYDAIENNPMGWVHIPGKDKMNHIKPESWPGAAGCMASHINVWKLAKANNWKNVLIIEDDCDFVDKLNKYLMIGIFYI